MIGKRLSHFHILDKIGEGGMGVVYRAEDEKLGRSVALKVLHPEFTADEERRQRFIREARMAAAVTHPNIATIHEIDEVDGIIFIAMELVEGEMLSKRIDGRPLTSDEALALAVETAAGLARAHQSGIVHRDLKPENIVLGPDGHLKILDFGLAKLHEERESSDDDSDGSAMATVSAEVTRDGRILGTVSYMSPEQARGLRVDVRSDVFSFGVLLYEMITGRKPFGGETITDTLSAILRDEQAPVAQFNPQVPAELERIIARCLEKKPANRYDSAEDLLKDLRRLKRITDSHSQPVPLVSDPSISVVNRPAWQRPLPVALGILLALIVVVAGVAVTRTGLFGGGQVAVQLAGNALAVLPFENLQDSEDAQRFGQILQELIITDLSGLETTNVLSSQRLFDVQKQLGRDESRTIDRGMATQVAKQAGAATMLTGSVNRLGDGYILTSQLVDLQDGTVIKSERIDGADIYGMVDDLTQRLHGSLGMLAAKGSDMAVKDRTSSSIEAYQAFLEGQDRQNALDWPGAVEEFKRAVEIDPDFGQAYYKLAIASWWAGGLDAQYSDDDLDNPIETLKRVLSGELKLNDKERLLAEATLALVERRYSDSQGLFAEATERFPDEKEAWYGLGEAIRHGSGRTREALEPFERAMELDPSFRLAYFHPLEIYAHLRMYDEGIRTARTLIEQAPEDVNWRAELAKLAIMKGDEKLTEKVIAKGREKIDKPEDLARFLGGVSEAYVRAGHFEESQDYIDQALAIEVDGGREMLLAQVGMFKTALHQYDEAESLYREAVAADPHNHRFLQGLAKVFQNQREYGQVIDEVKALIAEDPEFNQYYGYWLAAAIEKGDTAEIASARRAVEEILADDETSVARRAWLMRQAQKAYDFTNNAQEAAVWADRMLRNQPESAEMMATRGWAETELGNYAAAQEWFDKALTTDPVQVQALRGQVLLAMQSGDEKLAIRRGEELVRAIPDWYGSPALLVEAHLRAGNLDEAERVTQKTADDIPSVLDRANWYSNAANAYMWAGYYAEAESLATKAYDLLSQLPDPEIVGMIVWSMIQQGKTDQAEQILQPALKLAPRHWLLNISQAVVMMLQEDAAGAERILRDVLASGPARADFYGMLACALTEQGKFAEAEPYARRVFEMDPERNHMALLAYVLVAGDLDVERGAELAERALALPQDVRALSYTQPYDPSAEHAMGLAALKQGDYARAAKLLQQAADQRPDRAAIRTDLEQAVQRSASLGS